MNETCPLCGKPLHAVTRKDDGSVILYGCTAYPECRGALFPDPDNNGEPYMKTCPECHNGLRKAVSRRGNHYVACFNKEAHADGEAIFFDEDGSPRPRARGEFACPECASPLSYFRVTRGSRAGSMAFACFHAENHASGRPLFFDDNDGRPVLPGGGSPAEEAR